MARRSLQASNLGIEKAKRAFKRREWTQEYLALQVGIDTRQPIWKFFTGKPVERNIFMEICFQLGLDWEEIAELPIDSLSSIKQHDWDGCWDIDALVQLGRSRRRDKIQSQCSAMRLLDIAQPINLEDIYVNVNVLNHITGQRWLDIVELQLKSATGNCADLSQEQRVNAMQAVVTHPKLMLLGKPGSGKTTFLQYIATQCNQGKFLPERIPIFIRLKNFAEDAKETGNFGLLNYISQELSFCGASEEQIKALLNHGRLLILLDGLDEIPAEYSNEIVQKIRKLSEEYYKNQLIITCRLATQHYQFEGFTDIEIADFDSNQIEVFVQKWFVNVGKNPPPSAKALAAQFMQKLQLSENRQIKELAVTPLLLNLACCVFQARADFPSKRAELYKQALNILLKRWDEARSIKRDEFFRHLSLPHKLKLLSQIAASTFEQGQYFFAQNSVQQYITDYLRKLPNVETDAEELQFLSEAVLKSLEAHGLIVERARGIYSFSHLTFQEYLTAKHIVASSEPQVLAKLLDLVSHLTEPRWRKVFLLTTGILSNADYLLQLIKQHTDALVAFEPQLQQLLIWLEQKSLSVQTGYKPAAIRAFYLTQALPRELTWARDLSLAFAIDSRLAGNLAPDLVLDLALMRALSLSTTPTSIEQVLALRFALPECRDVCDSQLQQALEQLKQQLPDLDLSKKKLQEWWDINGQAWAEKLRAVVLEYRNIGHQWQLSNKQQALLKQYYYANQLLVDCLKLSCEISPSVREQVEDLLLPNANKVSCSLDKNGINNYVKQCT